MDENKIKRIEELVNILNNANDAYYNKNIEIMSNFEYDKLYDELLGLEKDTNYVMDNSPTIKVGAETSTTLKKVKHSKPMLSLDKTKDRNVLKEFIGDKEGVLSYKLDGLTIVLTYENGKFKSAVTRGNGEVGEDITLNAKKFKNYLPSIAYKGHLVLRGEAIITYSDFNAINDEIGAEAIKYKNPRNLCSGSVRQLNPDITEKRNVKCIIFSLVEIGNDIKTNEEQKIFSTLTNQFEFLDKLGFDTVFRKVVNKDNILDTINFYENDIKTCDNPSDGLVLAYNDYIYGISLGTTSKFPRNALAFKWQDEVCETTLLDIEWSPSRTGLINPIAIFEPVELEGTIVKRASLHNISIMEELKIGINDRIKVFKANMIIPQIAENLTKSLNFEIPTKCPSCGEKLTIKNNEGIKTLNCENIDCPIKHIKSFENFVSRNAMNIEGISISTIECFIQMGFIKEFADLYKLKNHKESIINLDGFGEKSYENIINAIDKSRNVNLSNLINALGILGIGKAGAKSLSDYFNNDFNKIRNASTFDLSSINDIGPTLSKSIYDYFHNEKNISMISNLLKEITINKLTIKNNQPLLGKVFVITGSLNKFSNRDELVKLIEDNGGKCSSSVSNKTSYLINNDTSSNSTKNKKAKELNIPILDENKFMELVNYE